MSKPPRTSISVPKHLQGFLWSADINQLNLQKDKTYIINQILNFGALDEFRWLFHAYPSQTITDVFLNHPIKEYTDSRFYLIKNFLLNLKQHQLNPNRYVKNLPRALG